MATGDKKETAAKVFDVADAKETKLDIGSKPMVIGHKASADPTLTTEKQDGTPDSDVTASETDTDSSSAPSKKIKIEPLSHDDENAESPNAEDSSQSSEDTENAEAKTKTDASSDASSQNPEKNKEQDKERDFVAEAENEEKSAQDAESEREEKVEELRKSKKYLVQVREKRETAFGKIISIFLAVLISVAGVYLLADAGVIPGGELLPTRFIGNDNSADATVVNEDSNVQEDTSSTKETEITNGGELTQSDQQSFVYTSVNTTTDTKKFSLESPAISFEYPSSFGDVSLLETADSSKVFFEFSSEKNYVFSIVARDRTGPSGHDSPTRNLQSYSAESQEVYYLQPDSKETEVNESAEIITLGQNYAVFDTAGIAYVVVGISLLPEDSTYESLIIDYLEGQDERFTAEDEATLQLKSILDTLSYE